MDFLQHTLNWQFVLSFLSIIVVDLTLSGDNAVVIAAAVKTLPPVLRKRALFFGAAGAILARVAAAFFAVRLLHVQFLQSVGGLAILWIAIGLFREEPPLESSATAITSFWRALWFISIADITMSIDNVLAIAGIAQGDLLLLIIGLSLSIPPVIFASHLLASLMDNYPIIVYLGAGMLGRVAGQMIMTDAFTVRVLAPGPALNYSVQAVCTVGVLAAGFWLKRRSARHAPNSVRVRK